MTGVWEWPSFFLKQGARVTITDSKTAEELRPTLEKLKKYKNIEYTLGGHKEEDFEKCDIVIQNPAIKPVNKYIRLAEELGKSIEMEMSLFHQLCPCSIVGITGTRGKSTTTTLIYKFLEKKYKNKVLLAGNIGKSAIRELSKLTEENLAVIELSSFQLYAMNKAKVAPPILELLQI